MKAATLIGLLAAVFLASSALAKPSAYTSFQAAVEHFRTREHFDQVDVTFDRTHPFSPASWWADPGKPLRINFYAPFVQAAEALATDEAFGHIVQQSICFVAAHEFAHIIQWVEHHEADDARTKEREADLYARGACGITREQSDATILLIVANAPSSLQGDLQALWQRFAVTHDNPNW